MKQQIQWFKEQLKQKKFRILLILLILVLVGFIAEFSLFQYGFLKILRYLILLTGLFLIAWIDQKEKRIPNKILMILLILRVFILAAEWLMYPEFGLSMAFSAGLGMLFGGGLFFVAYLVSRGGIGFGDVKLFAVIGVYMGSGSIFSVVFLTVVVSAVYSIVMLILKKIKLKEEIPFAPFVLIGAILSMALGM